MICFACMRYQSSSDLFGLFSMVQKHCELLGHSKFKYFYYCKLSVFFDSRNLQLMMFWNHLQEFGLCSSLNSYWTLKHFCILVSMDFSQCDGVFSLVEELLALGQSKSLSKRTCIARSYDRFYIANK